MTVASPQSSRCGPSSQRSPGRLTGTSGASGTSSPPPPSPSSPASNASSWSSSASEKPTSDRSKSSASQLLQLAGEQRLVPRPTRPACCPRSGRPGAAPRSDARARSPAPRSARAAWRPGPGHGPRSVRRPRPRGRERSSRTPPCWRRSWRPDPRHASSRSSHRAGACASGHVSIASGAKLRVMGGHPVGWAGGFRGVDSVTGFHWAAVDSFRGPAEATPGRVTEPLFY